MNVELKTILRKKIVAAINTAPAEGVSPTTLSKCLQQEGFDRCDIAEALLTLDWGTGAQGIIMDGSLLLRRLRADEIPRDEYGPLE